MTVGWGWRTQLGLAARVESSIQIGSNGEGEWKEVASEMLEAFPARLWLKPVYLV